MPALPREPGPEVMSIAFDLIFKKGRSPPSCPAPDDTDLLNRIRDKVRNESPAMCRDALIRVPDWFLNRPPIHMVERRMRPFFDQFFNHRIISFYALSFFDDFGRVFNDGHVPFFEWRVALNDDFGNRYVA